MVIFNSYVKLPEGTYLFFGIFVDYMEQTIGIAMCDTLVEPVPRFLNVFDAHIIWGLPYKWGDFHPQQRGSCDVSDLHQDTVGFVLKQGLHQRRPPNLWLSSWGKWWCEASDLGVPTNSNGLVDGFQMFAAWNSWSPTTDSKLDDHSMSVLFCCSVGISRLKFDESRGFIISTFANNKGQRIKE